MNLSHCEKIMTALQVAIERLEAVHRPGFPVRRAGMVKDLPAVFVPPMVSGLFVVQWSSYDPSSGSAGLCGFTVMGSSAAPWR
jgi:hypothetical protein